MGTSNLGASDEYFPDIHLSLLAIGQGSINKEVDTGHARQLRSEKHEAGELEIS